MRSELPAPLGHIEVVEVYVEYDEPMLYLARNQSGDHFLVNLVDEDEDGQVWLFAFMSSRRIRELRGGSLDLRDALLLVEGGVVWELKFDQTPNRQMSTRPILAADIGDEWLAREGVKVRLPPKVAAEPDLGAVAKEIRKVVAEVHLEPEDGNPNEVYVASLARFLDGFQSSLDAFGQVVAGRATDRSSIKAEDLQKTRLKAARAFDGSFGIELHSTEAEDLLAPLKASRATLAMSALLDLISIMGDETELKERLRGLRGSRVAIKILELLGGFKDGLSRVSIRWASPTNGHAGHVSLTRAQAEAARMSINSFEVTDPDTFQVIGTFSAANMDGKSYKLKPLEEGHQDSYSGRISDDLHKQLESRGIKLVGESQYKATIQVRVREDVRGATEKYMLVDAVLVDDHG